MSKLTIAVAAIAAVQLVVVLQLNSKIELLQNDIAKDRAVTQTDTYRNRQAPALAQRPNESAAAFPTESQLRQIIQEELRAQLENLSLGGRTEPPRVTETPVAAADLENQRAVVTQQLDYYMSIGNISDREMHDLQLNIAKLDEAGRQEMLTRLVRAMNTGRVDAHF